jgi:transposase
MSIAVIFAGVVSSTANAQNSSTINSNGLPTNGTAKTATANGTAKTATANGTAKTAIYPIEIERKFNLIHEQEWTGNTVTDICKKYGVSRKTYYKWWKARYENNGINGLHDVSKVPHTIKHKVDTATEETILDLRLKRFGCNRIRFRLKRLGVYLSSRTIYKVLKRHCLNILKCKIKNRRYKRFAKKHPNDMGGHFRLEVHIYKFNDDNQQQPSL